MKTNQIIYVLISLYSVHALANKQHLMPIRVTTEELKNVVVSTRLDTAPSSEQHERRRGKRLLNKLKENPTKQLTSAVKSGFFPQVPVSFYNSSFEKKGLTKPLASVAYVPNIGVNFTPSTRWDGANPGLAQSFPNAGSFGVGPTQIMSLPYEAFRSFDKQGNPDYVMDLDSATFFSPTGFQLPVDYTGDIISQYDQLSQRWFVIGNSDLPYPGITIQWRLFLAVSNGPIITNNTVWSYYTFIIPDIPPAVVGRPYLFADFPHMGIDSHAIYVAYDEFDSADTSYVDSSALVIQKSSVLNGGPAVIHAFRGLYSNDGTFYGTGVNNDDPNPQFGYIIGLNNNTYSALNLYRINNPGSTNPTISPVESLPINPIASFLVGAPQLGNLYGANGLLEMGFPAITSAVIRNSQLYTSTDAAVDNTGNTNTLVGDREGILWWQYDVSKLTSSLVQSGVIFDSAMVNPRWFYVSGIRVNAPGDVALAYTVSANDEYVNMAVSGRFASDPLGQMSDPVLVTNSQGPLNMGPNPSYGYQRFGEQTSVVLEPCDTKTMWASAEWVRRQDEWAVQVVQLLPPA